MKPITGTATAMIVPFKKNGEIDYNLYETLCFRQALAGNHIVSPGTTTESPTLTPMEHTELIRIGIVAKDEANRRNKTDVMMIAGVGSNSTREAIEYTEHALKFGADAGMSVVPYYNKPSQEGHLEHQRQIAQVGLPIMIYNIPSRAGSGMSAQTMLKAFEIENVVSLKAAFGVNDDLTEILMYKPEHISILSGDDTLTHYMLAMGAEGAVSVSSNMFPQQVNKYISSYNGSKESLQKFRELYPLFKANMAFGNPATIKEAMYIFRNELEIPEFTPTLRSPLVRINKNESENLERMLRRYF